MAERPAPTPQALREQAQRATRLADWPTDEQTRTILLDFAEELLERAALLEAVMTTERNGPARQRQSSGR